MKKLHARIWFFILEHPHLSGALWGSGAAVVLVGGGYWIATRFLSPSWRTALWHIGFVAAMGLLNLYPFRSSRRDWQIENDT